MCQSEYINLVWHMCQSEYKSEDINLVWHMCLLPAPISLCINTTERADALSYRRDWFDSSDIEMTSVA